PRYCNNLNVSFSRREFFGRFGLGLGGAALMTLLNQDRAAAAMSLAGAGTSKPANPFQGILNATHRPARAKRIIYLFMSGGPSQHDLFDYKPLLNKMNGQDLPASVRMGQRLT